MASLIKMPLELWLAILNEWTGDLKSLSNFDVAACNQSLRPEVLAMLAECRVQYEPFYCSDERIISFMLWVGSRHVKLPSLELGVHRIPELAAFSASSAFPSISSLHLKEYDEFPGLIEHEEMARFASCLPSLTALDCSEWNSFSDPHLLALAQCPLVAYTLEHCDLLTPACLVDVVLARQSTLIKLDCSVLDESALSVLAGRFSLRHLGFDCDRLCSQAVISFCSSFPSLQHLRLGMLYEGTPCPISDSVLRTLVAGCVNLHTLDVMDCPDVTCVSFPSIVQHCPSILTVLTTSYQWLTNARGRSSVTLALATSEEARPLLQSCPFPIQVLNTCGSAVGLDRSAVSILRDRFASELRELDVSLEADVPAEDLLALVQRGSRLESVHLSGCVMFTDEVLHRLSCLCPRVTEMALEDVHLVSSAAWMEWLGKLGARQVEMAGLAFVNCPTVTDEVLRRIAKHFPSLQRLHLQHTGITTEAVESILWEEGRGQARRGTTWYLPGEMVDALVSSMRHRGVEGWEGRMRLCRC